MRLGWQLEPDEAEPTLSEADHIEDCLYHALVPVLERKLNLEPCPAMKLAQEIAREVMREQGQR